MLTHLHVKNLALIEETEVDFAEGLNILTGETGAGKSILIGSINLALGQRISREMIRREEEPALVELVFEPSPLCLQQLSALDIPAEDGQVIISRKINGSRSISRINGETVPAALLRKAAEILIDIHGQHEHQSLLKREKHLEILDAFAREELDKPLSDLKKAYEDYQRLTKKIAEFTIDEGNREREIGFLQYEIEEIENADLRAGEDEQLEADFRKMSNGRNIVEGLNAAYQLTGGDTGSNAADYIAAAARELSSLTKYGQDMEGLFSQIQDIELLLEDFNRDTGRTIEQCQFSEEQWKDTEERLNLLNHLKAKYGRTLDEVLSYKEVQEEKLQELLNYENTLRKLQEDLKKVQQRLEACCQKVTKIRAKHAGVLAENIRMALKDLNFLDVQFQIQLVKTNSYSANGWDAAEFLISTNPGEEARPLGKVASGGELSRIMLAIKTVLSDKDEIETLIFDEIDVGISGRTAQKVSEKLAVIARSRQVLCITHLPQIAAMADVHFAIEKSTHGQETTTQIRGLSKEEMVEELARILGGAKITDTVMQSAREMKELAVKSK